MHDAKFHQILLCLALAETQGIQCPSNHSIGTIGCGSPHELPFHTAAFLIHAHQGPEFLRRRADDWNEFRSCWPRGRGLCLAVSAFHFSFSPLCFQLLREYPSNSRPQVLLHRSNPLPTPAMPPALPAITTKPPPGRPTLTIWIRRPPPPKRFSAISRRAKTSSTPAFLTSSSR